MADNVGVIVSFLRSKGLSDAAIAGILGNLQVESGESPTAYNAGEGAIGIAQWEGSRRTALQSYARAHGGHETDLNMQLGYMWQELSTSESGVLSQLRNIRSASQAAAIWDGQYERSSGTARSQREAAAEHYYSSGLKAAASGSYYSIASDGHPTSLLAAASTAATPDDFSSELSAMGLGGLLGSIPELKKLVDQAVSGNWSTSKFQNEIENSKWYRTNSSTARSVIAQQANDPATYNQNLAAVTDTIGRLASSLGYPLTGALVKQLAQKALLTGNDANTTWLTDNVVYEHNQNFPYQGKHDLTGTAGSTVAQLRALAESYGQNPSDSMLAIQAGHIITGRSTLDSQRAAYLNTAKSMFPGLSDQLDAGRTVAEIADPYVQTYSNLLEVDPATQGLNTPLVRQALQGMSGSGKGSTPQITPLWQFEQQVRQNPRWAYTSNAHQQMATMALQLGQTWGFN